MGEMYSLMNKFSSMWEVSSGSSFPSRAQVISWSLKNSLKETLSVGLYFKSARIKRLIDSGTCADEGNLILSFDFSMFLSNSI